MQLFYREEDSMGLSENKKQEIFFKNIELMCNIGVYKHEKEKPQRVIVNIKILLSDTVNPKNDKINETLNFFYIRTPPRPQEVAIGPRWTRTWLIEGVYATTREIPAAYASFLPYHGAMVCIEKQFPHFSNFPLLAS